MRRVALLVVVALLLAALVVPVSAQDGPPPLEGVVVDGLNYPRGIAFDADGNLYIAEAGIGGQLDVEMELPPSAAEGVIPNIGLSAGVTRLSADGERSMAVMGMPSLSMGAETLGVSHAEMVGGTLWVLLNEGPPGATLNAAFLGLNPETQRIQTYVDLFAFEMEHNYDGNEVYSNPSDFAVAPDGVVFIVDTGANSLYTWTPDDGLALFNTWPENPVPTSVAFDADGNLYVGFLGTGVAPGAGRVEHWTRDGELVSTTEGLTAVTDVLVSSEGNVYATQLLFFGEQGPGPGNVVMLDGEGGFEVVRDGLPTPYGLAQSPDGGLYVSVNSAFGPPGSGAVVMLN